MKIKKDNIAGIYITVIFHLTVIIVLLVYQIGREISKESSFVLDFTKQEELERIEREREEMEKEEAFKDQISDILDKMIAENPNARNIAVDRSSRTLKDDRGTDAEQLYKDAERLANELKEGQSEKLEDATDETVDLNPTKKTDDHGEEYKGTSVLSYNLNGRKLINIKNPTYQCYGSGTVTVLVVVRPDGRVVNAKIVDEVSSDNTCLREAAVRAARLSRFEASSTAPDRDMGDIVYQFTAQ